MDETLNINIENTRIMSKILEQFIILLNWISFYFWQKFRAQQKENEIRF